MSERPERLRKSAFARLLGKAPSYVTKLKDQGRLVLDGDGWVRVAESLALIERTKGGRDDVEDRWAAQRAGQGVVAPSTPANAASAPDSAPVAPSSPLVDLREQRASAELRRTRALAEQEEMAAAKMRGDLVPREEVDVAFRAAGAAVRAALDVLPDQAAPLVAPLTALDEVHAQLQDSVRNTLAAIDQAIGRQQSELAKGGKE